MLLNRQWVLSAEGEESAFHFKLIIYSVPHMVSELAYNYLTNIITYNNNNRKHRGK
jgi:hypothetical protein